MVCPSEGMHKNSNKKCYFCRSKQLNPIGSQHFAQPILSPIIYFALQAHRYELLTQPSPHYCYYLYVFYCTPAVISTELNLILGFYMPKPQLDYVARRSGGLRIKFEH